MTKTEKFMSRRTHVETREWGVSDLDSAEQSKKEYLKKMNMKKVLECESAITAKLRGMHNTW